MRATGGQGGWILGAMLMASLTRGAAAQTAAEELAKGASIPVPRGATLELLAVKGEASFLGSTGDEVVVEYARAVPGEVRVVAVTTPEGVTLCTVYASSDPKKPTECQPGGKGRLAAGKTNDLSSVQFRVRVPAGVHVTASIERGDLKTTGISGNLRLHSDRGDLLVWDAGGPGTIHASVGLLGKVDAVIAKDQKGPARRRVRLEAVGSGPVRVAMPATVGATYNVSTQRPAAIDPVFGVEKATPPLLRGHLGPVGDDQVYLDVDTGIAGQFMLVRAK